MRTDFRLNRKIVRKKEGGIKNQKAGVFIFQRLPLFIDKSII